MALGSLLENINSGVIKFIPKGEERTRVIHWRPLTMLNCSFKIIAKVFARRLRFNLQHWIRHEQKGFIKGRFILDSIIALWEGQEFATSSGQDNCFLKIDFDKAYDHIDWDFILTALKDLGLGNNFVTS